MATLFDDFVRHYTAVAGSNRLRQDYIDSWNGVDRTKEVDAVKSYLLDPSVGVDFLNQTVASKLSTLSFQVKFASVFCHQKPRVTRTAASKGSCAGDTNSCELGDLFALFMLFDSACNLHYAAGSLFQAKLSNAIKSKTQRCLYDQDKDFMVPIYLEKRPASPGKLREMPSYSMGRAKALRYLILAPEAPMNAVKVRFTPSTNTRYREWPTFLDGLLAGTDGLPVGASSGPSSAWDIIVDDLLYMGSRVPAKKPGRGNHHAVKLATALFNDFSDRSMYSVESTEDGVPMLLIIANARVEHELPRE